MAKASGPSNGRPSEWPEGPEVDPLSSEYELLRRAMPRVRPSPEFRSRLQARLDRQARHAPARVEIVRPADHTRDAVLAAAAVFAAGLAFLVWHRRSVGTHE